MNLVLDASVALKWFFRTAAAEADTEAAGALLDGVFAGRHRMVEPAHFAAEVGAVLARKTPFRAKASMLDLLNVAWTSVDSPDVLMHAVVLATRLQHHLFDTLYHAVALESDDALLVTADERYYRKSAHVGRIARLADFAALH